MEPKIVNLGKVCITVEGNYDFTKDYDKLCMVFDEETCSTYISRKFVPVGIPITNDEYWQYLCNDNLGYYTEQELEEDFNEIFGL